MLKIFSKPTHTITAAAALVASFSLLSRLLGIFRDRILAGQFGAGEVLDAYYAAFRIPDLIFNLLVLGALSAGFIPVFTGFIKDFSLNGKKNFLHNKEGWIVANNVLNLILIALIAVSVLGIIFARPLTSLIAPGFSASLQDTTVQLTRIMFLSPIFLGVSSILGGVLQSFKKFFAYSLAPIMYNLGIIFGALYLVPKIGLAGLAWGVVLGAFLHMMIQLPATINSGFRYCLLINLKHPGVRKILKMMVPRTMALAVSQINLLVITIIASSLVAGSLTVFNLANNLQSFPIGIFGISFAIAAFPTFSRLSRNKDKEKLKESFSKTFRTILFFVIPATVLLITLRAQIIRIILGTGAFNWQDTILTMDTLGMFALSLFAQASIPLLVRVFYARHNSATPFWLGLVSMAVNVMLSFYFANQMGVAGLALAFSISAILNFLLLWIFLHHQLGDLNEKGVLISIAKFSGAAIVAGVTVQVAKVIIWPFVDMSTSMGIFWQGLGAGVAGITVYILLCSLFKVEEIKILKQSLRRRLPWNKVDTEDQGQVQGI